ncbi:MAG TPA: isochorismatase family cysteine hydrolase [Acidimicrobiales bacterium]|nr:isochorismatase family cysteine hydrolase [Acidimicrobiales bacterium]
MIVVEGKSIFTEPYELVDPAHTALVLVDMQNDFAEPEGAFGQLGVDLSAYAQLRANLAGLLQAARDAAVMVVHVQMTTLPQRLSDSPAQIRFNMRMHESFRRSGPPLRYTVVGSVGHQFLEEFGPREGEFVVQKSRSSAFWGTNLDQLLESNGVTSLVVTGLTTEGCVESTARDAQFNDYYVVIAPDCVASDDPAQHDASMLLMRNRFDIISQGDIEAVWEKSRAMRADSSDRRHSNATTGGQ